MIRGIRRNHLRKKVGNRNLKKAWGKFQRNKYGDNYLNICKVITNGVVNETTKER